MPRGLSQSSRYFTSSFDLITYLLQYFKDNPIVPVLITGPTASGKSSIAQRIAEAFSAHHKPYIINCDSSQVYSNLPILTASPSPEMQNTIQHFLFQYIDLLNLKEQYNVARWLSDTEAVIQEQHRARHTPIIVGGTGMYADTFLHGIDDIPSISKEVYQKYSYLSTNGGSSLQSYHEELKERDPIWASKTHKHDAQRIIRAYAIYKETGKLISQFYSIDRAKIRESLKIYIDVKRNSLHTAIEERLNYILRNGATQEVEVLLSGGFDISKSPRIIGLSEIAEHISGRLKFSQMHSMMLIRTRQYAKRQMTWFRNKYTPDIIFSLV